jgi:hypothetical protein
MARLTNAETQARWRERHIEKRRRADRVANLLVRVKWPKGAVEELADLLSSFLTQEGIRALRRALKPATKEDNAASLRGIDKQWRDLWLRDHPGRTAADYNRLLRDNNSEVMEWRRAWNERAHAATKAAWERDHPGEIYPEHQCGLSDREYTDLARWRRQRERRQARAALTPGPVMPG